MNLQNQMQKVIFGETVFKKNFNQNLLESNEIQIILYSKNWCIPIRYFWQQLHHLKLWKQIFLDMVESTAEILSYTHSDNFQIIKQIHHIQFTNLKHLSLFHNNIQSVELLSGMNFQHLQRLDLSFNRICQVKCFKKSFMNCLSQIVLIQNPIFEIDSLTRSKINLKQFLDLSLEDFWMNNAISQDLSALAKLSCQSLSNLRIRSENRIIQFKVQHMMEMRFHFIKLDTVHVE